MNPAELMKYFYESLISLKFYFMLKKQLSFYLVLLATDVKTLTL